MSAVESRLRIKLGSDEFEAVGNPSGVQDAMEGWVKAMEYRRVLLEIAMSADGQFKLELVAQRPEDLKDPKLIRKAIARLKEWLETVALPDAELRAKWRQQDEAEESSASLTTA
jgi:hypothetical protein